MNMNSKKVQRQRQAMASKQKAWDETMGDKKVTLYTLAPATLDRAGTESVGSYWLYRDDDVPEQALREVTMPESKHIAQHQAYIGHQTYTEVGLKKALARGEVYRHDNGISGVAFDPMKAVLAIDKQANQKEVQAMPAKKLNKAQQIAAEKFARETQIEAHYAAVEKTPSALEAILAAPIVAAAVVEGIEPEPVDMAAEQEEKALARAISMQPVGTMPIDYKTLAQEIIAALKAEGLVMAHAGIMPPAVEPEPAHVPLSAREDSVASIMAAMNDTPMAQPAKPRSTLKVFTTSNPAEKTVTAQRRTSSVDDTRVAAIRKDYLSGGMTQAALARKYDLSNQKIWHIVTGK